MGSFFVINGSVTVGNLQAFIRYIWQINDPLSQVSQLSSQVQSAYAAMNRIFTLLNETEEVQKGSVKIDVSQIQGNVTFDHVQFGYTDELLMKDVSFRTNGCDCRAYRCWKDHADESAASFLRCERRVHQN